MNFGDKKSNSPGRTGNDLTEKEKKVIEENIPIRK